MTNEELKKIRMEISDWGAHCEYVKNETRARNIRTKPQMLTGKRYPAEVFRLVSVAAELLAEVERLGLAGRAISERRASCALCTEESRRRNAAGEDFGTPLYLDSRLRVWLCEHLSDREGVPNFLYSVPCHFEIERRNLTPAKCMCECGGELEGKRDLNGDLWVRCTKCDSRAQVPPRGERSVTP